MIVLEPFTEDDFPQLIAWINSERLLKTWGGAQFTYPLTAEQLRRYLHGANGPQRPAALIYKAVDTRRKATIGHIALGHLNWEERTGRIAQVLVGEVARRGQGLGQAVVQALLYKAFGELGLQRVGLGVYDFNSAALRCYQRCGFQHIGTLRHVARYGEEWWSSVEMSLQAYEWRDLSRAAAPASHRGMPAVGPFSGNTGGRALG